VKGMNIWITSDTHYEHFNIIDYEKRPFSSPREMTEVLIDNWNKRVGKNDLVFHLGDVFFCKADRMKEIAESLNGRKILIRGNHDKGVTNGKFKSLGFDVHNYYFLGEFLLSHYPQSEVPLRIAIENGLLKGNIHGHVHSKIDGLDQNIYRCVSVELTDYAPINFEEIKMSFAI
jgi:calcineurin-like phosphoesterase family protein